MIEDVYRNSFKEVYDILENTESELTSKISTKFMKFITDNMNKNYQTNIQLNVDIDKQPLSKETEAILSLIYRSYWATNEEKQEFSTKDHKEFVESEQAKMEKYQRKDIYQIFEQRKNINKITIDNNLMVIKKESFIITLFNKILNIFRK